MKVIQDSFKRTFNPFSRLLGLDLVPLQLFDKFCYGNHNKGSFPPFEDL